MTVPLSQQKLGHHQRMMLSDMASRGRVTPPTQVKREVCWALSNRDLAAQDPDKPDTWVLTNIGYAWLITDEAQLLGTLSWDSEAFARTLDRIAHLAACCKLAQLSGSPVNWRGDLV